MEARKRPSCLVQGLQLLPCPCAPVARECLLHTTPCGWSEFPPPTTVHGCCTEVTCAGPELEQRPGCYLCKRVASSVAAISSSFQAQGLHYYPWPSHTRNALSSWTPRKVVRAIQRPSQASMASRYKVSLYWVYQFKKGLVVSREYLDKLDSPKD